MSILADDMTTLVDDYTTWGGFVPTEAYEFDITTYMSRHSLGLDQESTQAKPYTREIKPYTHSDKPYTQSDKPYTQNAKTYKQSEKPLTRSDKPLTRSDKPLTRSDKPLSRSDKPLTRSDKPLTRSDKPLTRSDKPLTRSDKPLTRSDKPLTRSDKPYIQTTASGSLGNDTVTQTTGVPRVSDWKNDSYPENNSTKQGNVEENSTPESDFVWNTTLADSGCTAFGAFLPTIILVVCASFSNALMQNL